MIYIKWRSSPVLFSYEYHKTTESFNLYDSLSPPVFHFLLLDRYSTGRSPVHSVTELPRKMDFTIAENVLVLCNDRHMCRSMVIASCSLGTITFIYTADTVIFFRWFYNTVQYTSVPDGLPGPALHNASQRNPPKPSVAPTMTVTHLLPFQADQYLPTFPTQCSLLGSRFASSKCKEILQCLRYHCKDRW